MRWRDRTIGDIESMQGRGGGIRLLKRSKDIIVGEIVRKTESTLNVIDRASAACPLEPDCRLKGI